MTPFSDKSEAPSRLFLAVLVAFFVCAMLMMLITAGFSAMEWIDLSGIKELKTSIAERQQLRGFLLISNLVPFAGTAFLALIFVFRRQWASAAGLKSTPAPGSIFHASIFFIAALPFVAWLAYLNMQISLPDWMQASEDSTDALLKGILTMETIPELMLALLTVAVTPALGEELLMRGVLQRRVFQPWFGNHHMAIWAAAILFSAVHLEFAGFAPRLLLGVLLGYGYYWSGALWVPILLHLAFNGMQVMVAYVTGEFDPSAEITEVPPWWAGMISLAIIIGIGWWSEVKFGKEHEPLEASGADAGPV
jgi:membrane protease YdiL (CAAX protease family)